MMVLAKLDNSLLQQQQSFVKESSTTSTMAKTGGFVGKKKGNKVLTAYLAEKTIEDFDRRQMLIKQALDNNQKVNSNSTHATAVTTNSKVTDRRKSANAGLRAGRAVEHAVEISS